MKKMFQRGLALLTAVMLLSGCAVPTQTGNGSTEKNTQEKTQGKDKDVAKEKTQGSKEEGEAAADGKILYFVVGNLGDLSYGDLGWWATQAVAEKYGYAYDVVEGGTDTSTLTTTLCDAIETGGYTHVIAAGWYILDDILALAGTDYKDIKFILFDTGVDVNVGGLDNVYCISYKANEASFLTAVYLGLMSKSGKIGAISCNDSPLLNDFVTGFVQGSKYCSEELDLGTEHLVTYIGAQTIQNNYETACVLYDQGIDAIFNIGSTTALGACQAAEERGGYEKGYILVGVDADQYQIYKSSTDTDVNGYENIATSMLKCIEESVMWAFDGMNDKTLEPGLHNVGIAEGGVGLAKNENYLAITPEDVQKKVEEIETKIASGEIVVRSYYGFSDYEEFAAYRDN
ncbi:BMP family lipoprotein [Enterocloster citroniae]|uniref:BMP family lipoprotein n=1 Tax=Enterocloster citroniae TaxID=358743 RepID=UPI00349EDAC4